MPILWDTSTKLIHYLCLFYVQKQKSNGPQPWLIVRSNFQKKVHFYVLNQDTEKLSHIQRSRCYFSGWFGKRKKAKPSYRKHCFESQYWICCILIPCFVCDRVMIARSNAEWWKFSRQIWQEKQTQKAFILLFVNLSCFR